MNSHLSQRSIFWLWAPLAASWALMTVEYPIIQFAIAGLPDVEVMLAAVGLVIVLEITIESPVIMLLATTTAFARSPAAYRVLRRFTLHLNVFVTVIAALVAFVTPVYTGLVEGLLEIPKEIADPAQPAMQVMTLWSAAIGWRRFQQGILIRHGRTRAVGAGTMVRLVFAASTAIGLASLGSLTGVMVGAYSWMAGVLAEAVFVHFVARSTIRKEFLDSDQTDGSPLTYKEVFWFHAPLALTSLLSLIVAPVVQGGLARMPFPKLSLAAWPILFAILLLFRSPGFALPEAVIALLDRKSRVGPLRRFSIVLSLASSAGLALFLLTPAYGAYIEDFLRVPEAVRVFVLPGLLAGTVIPLIQSLQSWYRGILMAVKQTSYIYWGMLISLVVIFGLVWLAVELQGPGTLSCTAAISVGMTLEMVFLGWFAHRAEARLPDAPASVS